MDQARPKNGASIELNGLCHLKKHHSNNPELNSDVDSSSTEVLNNSFSSDHSSVGEPEYWEEADDLEMGF